MPSAVSLKNVHLSLPSRAGTVDILRGIDLEVESGEALGIVGPSGSGKTTILMVIAGLERVTKGEVEVAGTCWPAKTKTSSRSSGATPSVSCFKPSI